MYLLNPTQKMLDNCFQANKWVGNYLETHGVPVLHINNGVYYFIHSARLLNVLEEMPIYLKIIEWI